MSQKHSASSRIFWRWAPKFLTHVLRHWAIALIIKSKDKIKQTHWVVNVHINSYQAVSLASQQELRFEAKGFPDCWRRAPQIWSSPLLWKKQRLEILRAIDIISTNSLQKKKNTLFYYACPFWPLQSCSPHLPKESLMYVKGPGGRTSGVGGCSKRKDWGKVQRHFECITQKSCQKRLGHRKSI